MWQHAFHGLKIGFRLDLITPTIPSADGCRAYLQKRQVNARSVSFIRNPGESSVVSRLLELSDVVGSCPGYALSFTLSENIHSNDRFHHSR